MPRFLPLLLAVLAVLYGGYWFFGKSGIETAAREALNRPEIRYETLDTVGFPSRFDTTVSGIEATTADGRITWTAPFFQVFMLSYAPQNIIAVWPDSQSLRIGDEVIEIASDRMRASATLGLATSLPLRRATFEADAIRIDAQPTGGADIARVLLAIRQAGGEAPGHRYDLFAELIGVEPDAAILSAGLVTGETGPGALRVDAVITLDQPIDRTLDRFAPRRIDLGGATLRWGGLTVVARGTFDDDGTGLKGAATVEVSDGARLVGLVEEFGLLTAEAAATLGRALAPVTAEDGSVTLPLQLRQGRLRVAGLPLGQIGGP